MLITEFVLENYGIYRDHNEMSLVCTPDKPIVLVRGLNGNGKTTILEGMMVALYGKMYLGTQATKKEYMEFIQNRMHRSTGFRTKQTALSVAFKFHHNGKDDLYHIRREWTRDDGIIDESLVIKKNGEIMPDMDGEQWRQFIEGLIPYGIAKLFFFDGDRMNKIAKWDKQGRNPELKKSFDMLLGTELVKRLKMDLDVYVMRKSGKIDPTLMKQHNEYDEDKKDIQTSIASLQEEVKCKLHECNNVISKIRVLESEVLNMGGWYSKKRETLILKRGATEEKITKSHETLTSILNEITPFYILSDSFLSRIVKKLVSDAEFADSKFAQNLIEKKMDEIEHDTTKNNTEHRLAIIDTLKQMLDVCKNEKSNFDLSPNERNDLIDWISNKKSGLERLHNTSKNYTIFKKKQTQIETDIANVPKDDEIGPKISELNSLNLELGGIQTEIEELKRKIASKESYLRIVRSRMEKLIKTVHKSDKRSTGVKLAGRMQTALISYYSGLKEKKMKQLEGNLIDAIHVLMRKSTINKVFIDRDNFSIIPYDSNGDQIEGGFMSMGEKQIIGTALLWALTKTSGRPLPFVIDTPLARLDGIHRAKLVEFFYPFASHQTIILSTDKEIDQDEYSKIKKFVSHTFSLVQDNQARNTSIVDGYIMENKIATK